jgi:exosortase A-associated hydrolase 2
LLYRSAFIRNRRGARLFCAEEQPSAGDTRETWLICSPILEEKNVAHGAFVTLGRALAATGIRAVRIDYEGHGDSDGDTGELGLADWTNDVCDAAEQLAADAGQAITLLGCRAGALVAAQAAARIGARRLVAWCPVLQGEDHVHDLLRLNLTTQISVYKKVQQDRDAMIAALSEGGTVNIVGWTMGRALLESLMPATLGSLLRDLSCPVHILDLTRRAGDPPSEAAAALGSQTVAVQAVHGLPFWIDGNYLDSQQTRLVDATLALAGAAS